MAALSASKEADRKDGEMIRYPVAADTHLYKGAMVCVNASGYAVPGSDTSGLLFIGIAMEEADNTGGADGAASLRVFKTGTFEVVKATASQADVGKPWYIVDDQTVSDAGSTTNDILAGYAVECPGSGALRLRIDRAVQ